MPIVTNCEFKLRNLIPTKSVPENGHKVSIAEFFKVDVSEIEFGDEKLGGESQNVVMRRRFRTKEVAIELMQKGVVDHPSKREISLLFSTPHPNIVQAMAWIVTRTQFHIVMEFFNGASLYEVIINEEVKHEYNFYPEDAKINAVKGTAPALSACHLRPRPIVHRDIKPSNILSNKALQVKMCGFGKCQDFDVSLMSECSGSAYGTFTHMPLLSTVTCGHLPIVPASAHKSIATGFVDGGAILYIKMNAACYPQIVPASAHKSIATGFVDGGAILYITMYLIICIESIW
ncbi:hypothetical protein QAD02_020046 [Eretmocerus hayati]|uniref:Uncharacterized protein n=1 Tax=Eretmocerus hayati TaxID=131215 RepID=A0ACC2PLU0_9HYME|nr:hypothetical protein QAD02_020046 [Eretmocerus hayati]